jgi:hypothetical protein
MIQLPSSGGLNFEASDQLDQLTFWFNLVQLILSKFLSNFKVLVIKESGTTQACDWIWCNIYKSFRCSLYFWQLILSVKLDRSIRQLILRCSLFFRQHILSDEVFNRSWVLTRTRGGSIQSGWVPLVHCLYRLCECVVEGSYEGVYVWGQVCATGIYDNLLGFGLTCVLSATTINSVFSGLSCKYAKSRAHWIINEEQKFDSRTKFQSMFWTNKNYQLVFFTI